MQTGALLLDGNTLNYFGNSIPINLIVAVAAEVVLVGGAEYYRIINGLVSQPHNLHALVLHLLVSGSTLSNLLNAISRTKTLYMKIALKYQIDPFPNLK